MKKILYIFTILCVAIGLHSCTDDNTVQLSGSVVDGDQIHLKFSVQMPDMKKVTTRALDPTGKGVNVLWLFNFDAQGAFLGRVLATTTTEGTDREQGTFSASIPSTTRIVHLLANQNLDEFQDNLMLGKHENTVMNGLVSTSGGLVYWGRVADTEATSAEAFASSAFATTVLLYRNMAKITVDATYMEIQGLTVCNQYAMGASIPFNGASYPEDTPDFVTLPEDRTKMADLTEVEAEPDQTTYVFESPNTGDDEMAVIIKSKTNKYYKISLLDSDGKSLSIVRNHSYNIQFVKEVPADEDGYDSFDKAKAGAAYNNALIAIDDDIPSITVDGVTLGVEETTVVCMASGSYTLNYTYKGGTDEVEATWISNDGVAQQTINVNPPSTDGSGTIQITAYAPTETVHRGTIRVKAGRLIRYIKVLSFKEFEFTPTWVSNGIYSGATRESVAFVFDIPSTYPKELLPVRCLITTNQLDGNGKVPLSVINQEDCLKADGKTIDESLYGTYVNDYGYKYVYEADSVGMHRIYFQTSLSGQTSGNIVLEANYFTTLKKQFTYIEDNNHQLHIVGPENGVYMYTGEELGSKDDTPIYYFLAPRRTGSAVEFYVQYGEEEGGDFTDLKLGDKIRIYTSMLKPNIVEMSSNGITITGPYTATDGGGQYYLYTATGGHDKLCFNTLSPGCAETIRFASVNANDDGIGNYKSITMELENYLQWTFPLSALDENDTEVKSIDYGIGVPVKLSFDLAMAVSSHNRNEEDGTGGDEVYPTGTYECYIYTENLTPDESGNNTDSGNYLDTTPQKDANGKTYYVYHVSKSVEVEHDVRTLSFHTNKIVSAETVTLKPNTKQISFVGSTATFTNTPITGSVTFGNTNEKVPVGGFVTLIRKDGTRIGVVTMTAAGKYSMTLRGEYSYGWEEPLHMYYALADGSTIYSSDAVTLSELMKNPDVTLPNDE